MNLLQRFGYYLGGFAIGLVILAFFLNGKKVSCSYGPQSRVLKNIRNKPLHFSKSASLFVENQGIDSLQLNTILRKGDVVFSKSEPHKKPCSIYYIESKIKTKKIALKVTNCDSIATLQSIKWLP